MMNPNGDEFNDVPPGTAADLGGETAFGQFRPIPDEPGSTWEQAKEKAGVAAERTQVFMRENPIPTLIGALGIGIAIGLAIRYASNAPEEEEPITAKINDKLSDAWSLFSLPFLLPLWKSVREKAEDAAEVVSDTTMDGVKRLKKVKVASYTKPIKKRWKSWTS